MLAKRRCQKGGHLMHPSGHNAGRQPNCKPLPTPKRIILNREKYSASEMIQVHRIFSVSNTAALIPGNI